MSLPAKKFFLLALLVLSGFCAFQVLAAEGSGNPCPGDACRGPSYSGCVNKASPGSDAHVGPFLCDISSECYKTGNCSLSDIMIVFNNIGVYALGIVGSLVLLMYVYGGLVFLTARGDANQVAKGKSTLIKATIGMIIVFAAYAAIISVDSILRNRDLSESIKEQQQFNQ